MQIRFFAVQRMHTYTATGAEGAGNFFWHLQNVCFEVDRTPENMRSWLPKSDHSPKTCDLAGANGPGGGGRDMTLEQDIYTFWVIWTFGHLWCRNFFGNVTTAQWANS